MMEDPNGKKDDLSETTLTGPSQGDKNASSNNTSSRVQRVEESCGLSGDSSDFVIDDDDDDNDCIVMSDKKCDDDGKSGVAKKSRGSQRSRRNVDVANDFFCAADDDDDSLAELGLKIQNVVSLSSVADVESSYTDCEIVDDGVATSAGRRADEKIDVVVKRTSSGGGRRSVVEFCQEEFGYTDDSTDRGRERIKTSAVQRPTNGSCRRNGEPVVSCRDILDDDSDLFRRDDCEKGDDRVEDDCVVISDAGGNDSKTQDVILVDDTQESETRADVVFDDDGDYNDLGRFLSSSTGGSARDLSVDVAATSVSSSSRVSENPDIVASGKTRPAKRPVSPTYQDNFRKFLRTESVSSDVAIVARKSDVVRDVTENSADLFDTPTSSVDVVNSESSGVNDNSTSLVRPSFRIDVPSIVDTSRDVTTGRTRSDLLPSSSSSSGRPVGNPEHSKDENVSKQKVKKSSDNLSSSSHSLVSYDLSDDDEADEVSVIEEIGVSSASCSKNGVRRVTTSTPLPAVNSISAALARLRSKHLTRAESPSKETPCPPLTPPTSVTIDKKMFYGDKAGVNCNVFPAQYGPSNRKRDDAQMHHDADKLVLSVKLRKKEECRKELVPILKRTLLHVRPEKHKENLKEVVHISSDEDDASKDDDAPKRNHLSSSKHNGKRRDGIKIKILRLIYRTMTFVPMDCYMTRTDLVVLFRGKLNTIGLNELNLDFHVLDTDRLVFHVPSTTAEKLDKIFNCLTANVTVACRLTVIIDPSTSADAFDAWFDSAFAPPSKLNSKRDENAPARSTAPRERPPSLSKSKKKILRKKKIVVPTWKKHRPFGRPKPFFYRYGGHRWNGFLPRSAAGMAYFDDANDATMHVEPSGNWLPTFSEAPIQVSGFSGAVIKLFTYPPPPAARGITVTNEDLFCLNAGEYVNDVIIDFYLKYVFNELLSPADQVRTHIFSSFFYGHLVSESGKSSDGLTFQEQRHAKVRTWTRQVDLFSKDFVIVPINESYHWFLAIICFPGIVVEPQNKDVANNDNKTEDNEKTSTSDKSTTSTKQSALTDNTTTPTPVNKRPCILIFDSLQGEQRWDVSKTLREYLEVEWNRKKRESEGPRTFDKDQMKGCRPPCPQQPNYSDCGLYLLQYVEAFFQKPLKDFTLPIRYLRKWFDGSEARAKRLQIRTIILDLKTTLNPELEYDPLADGCCNDVAVFDEENVM